MTHYGVNSLHGAIQMQENRSLRRELAQGASRERQSGNVRLFDAAAKARPRATDVNSFPPWVRSRPNRLVKIRRTAGTNEVPPVRKTRSTSCGLTPVLLSSKS